MLPRIVVALLCAVVAGPQVPGAQPAAARGSTFVISGTSTVRAWSCPAQGTVRTVSGTSAQPVQGLPHGVEQVEVRVPVKAIACEEPLMLEHLRETLNEKAYPEIVYVLTRYTLTGADTVQATGTLTITGVTKPIDLTVRLSASPGGLRTAGETTIDLTQFSIAPPVIFDGLLKVGKDVRIRFDALLSPADKRAGVQ